MLVAQTSQIKALLDILAKDYEVFVPVKNNQTSEFVPLGNDTEILLDENAVISPKELFFPQTEKMYKCKVIKNTMEIEEIPKTEGKRLLFGVRSCDMKSVECLDQVFLTKGFVDEFYKHKRENTAIIALNCSKPMATCFCGAMGIDPQKAVGADVQTYLVGDQIGFEPLTEKGKEIVTSIQEMLKEQDAALPAFGEYQLKVDAEGVTEKLKGMFEAPIWDEVSRKCLNCGACTYSCPTCHCFDISQEVRGERVTKIRCWDSCMFGEYTMMAGGHNPRPTKKERVRNRFMHKLSYFPERYGMLLCTGCGRCINVCPVNMDITSVIRTVKEAD